MSLEQVVSEVLGVGPAGTSSETVETVNLALAEVSRLLSITDDTLHGLCLEVESATSKDAA